MKVGDYIRTKKGTIYQFNSTSSKALNGAKKYAVKSSPNIIDLIDEGDVLKVNDFKDVYTIYEVEMFRNPYTNEKYLGIRNDFDRKPKRLYEIPLVNLSIVTKEQFESMEYKV